MEITLLLEVRCRRCGRLFHVCRRCWRGQLYCSDPCRSAARRQARRDAQRRYRQSGKGRKQHLRAERRRRLAQGKKIMADQGSTPARLRVTLSLPPPANPPNCHFCGACGVVVAHFERRGYGRRHESQSIVRRL